MEGVELQCGKQKGWKEDGGGWMAYWETERASDAIHHHVQFS